jgi:hypothetical protein
MNDTSLDKPHRKRFKERHIIVGLLAGLFIGIAVLMMLHELRLL